MKLTRKQQSNYNQVITVYGQNSVQEALKNQDINCLKIHVDTQRKDKPRIKAIIKYAEARNLPIRFHTPKTLSQISKNARQDQGVALDIRCPSFLEHEVHLKITKINTHLVALDGITNPKNVGIVIRSATASGMDGVIYPRDSAPRIGPLVIQSSAGTIFRAPIIKCSKLEDALIKYLDNGFEVIVLNQKSKNSLFDMPAIDKAIYVLGGETTGHSRSTKQLASYTVSIPMENDVESLNVAATASILFYFVKYNRIKMRLKSKMNNNESDI